MDDFKVKVPEVLYYALLGLSQMSRSTVQAIFDDPDDTAMVASKAKVTLENLEELCKVLEDIAEQNHMRRVV